MAKIGIDIGGTNIAAGLVAENGTMTARRSLPFPRGKGLDAVLTVCDTLVDALFASVMPVPVQLTNCQPLAGVAVIGWVLPWL